MLAGIKNRKSNDPHKWYFPNGNIPHISRTQALELCRETDPSWSSFHVNNSTMWVLCHFLHPLNLGHVSLCNLGAESVAFTACLKLVGSFHVCVSVVRIQPLSHVRMVVTLWTVDYWAPPSMGFSKRVYWSVLPFCVQGDLPDPGSNPHLLSPALQVDSLPLSYWGSPIPYMSMLSYFNRVQLCATPWTVAHQAPLSMGFSRQEYWSGLPCLPLGDLLSLLHCQMGSLPLAPPGKPILCMTAHQRCFRHLEINFKC